MLWIVMVFGMYAAQSNQHSQFEVTDKLMTLYGELEPQIEQLIANNQITSSIEEARANPKVAFTQLVTVYLETGGSLTMSQIADFGILIDFKKANFDGMTIQEYELVCQSYIYTLPPKEEFDRIRNDFFYKQVLEWYRRLRGPQIVEWHDVVKMVEVLLDVLIENSGKSHFASKTGYLSVFISGCREYLPEIFKKKIDIITNQVESNSEKYSADLRNSQPFNLATYLKRIGE
eukprot:NODE_210_length_12844_cov_1.045822.p8 type:complete len:232 gc:universal NODE_210_length_12844_cov_1.045822:5786-5091(-)